MHPDDLDDAIKLAELGPGDFNCELNHGPRDPGPHPACQCIVQKMGNLSTGQVLGELRIPICADCLDALTTEDGRKTWVLQYCYRCGSSQWIIREIARRNYPEAPIFWRDWCPNCRSKG